MPYLYCQKHGREREDKIIRQESEHQQEGEFVLIVAGTLISSPWLCDSCNAQLKKGDTAVLVSTFPSHYCDELRDYDFGYERQYFAMKGWDRATAYGVAWPDDSIIRLRDAP